MLTFGLIGSTPVHSSRMDLVTSVPISHYPSTTPTAGGAGTGAGEGVPILTNSHPFIVVFLFLFQKI